MSAVRTQRGWARAASFLSVMQEVTVEQLDFERPNGAPRHRLEIDKALLLDAWRIHADADWSFPAHEHQNWEFIYFVRGSGRIDVPHATLRPHAYDLIAYPPGTRHSEQTSRADPEVTLCFEVDIPGEVLAGGRMLLSDQTGEIGWLCERIVSEFEAHGRSPLAHSYARTFLHVVERVWESGAPVQHDPVDLAVRYIHANYPKAITLGALADAAHVSKSHLIHRFDARLGISPLRYLQRVRVEAAKHLLLTAPMPVKEIARQVGFPDPLYFSRAFARITGIAPTVFRKQAAG